MKMASLQVVLRILVDTVSTHLGAISLKLIILEKHREHSAALSVVSQCCYVNNCEPGVRIIEVIDRHPFQRV